MLTTTKRTIAFQNAVGIFVSAKIVKYAFTTYDIVRAHRQQKKKRKKILDIDRLGEPMTKKKDFKSK